MDNSTPNQKTDKCFNMWNDVMDLLSKTRSNERFGCISVGFVSHIGLYGNSGTVLPVAFTFIHANNI